MLSKVIKYVSRKLTNESSTEELIKKGLRVGKNFARQREVVIDYSFCWLITIGDHVTLAPRVHILAHDASTKHFTNYTKIGQVVIGNNVFVGAGSIILPNVRIGNNVVIGSGSVVTKDIPDNSLAIGNPVRVVSTLEEYINRNKKLLDTRPIFDRNWTLNRNITDIQKKEMFQKLKDGIGYVE